MAEIPALRWKWIRRALFQVHLWIGLLLGLYIILISVTGSAVVFRREFAQHLLPRTVPAEGHLLTEDEIRVAARRAYPGYEVTDFFSARREGSPVSIVLVRGDDTKERRFNPYTGADMGDVAPRAFIVLEWVVDLHDNLLSGRTGRVVNGIASVAIVVLVLSGSVIWWRGVSNWYRGLFVQRKGGWRRMTFDLHSMLGFWSLAFLLMWAVTGIYFAFPEWFYAVANFFEPETDENYGSRTADQLMGWLVQMHFGRFGGLSVRVTWTILGLIPAVLAVTGALLWWHRVLRPALQSSRNPTGRASARRLIPNP